MGSRIAAFLIGFLSVLFVQAQPPVQTIGTTNNRVVVRNQFKVDSALILPERKTTTTYLSNGLIYNKTLKTIEVYDSTTATWYPLYRMTFTDGRISGAEVTWMGGLTFQVSSASYAIGGRNFNFEADDVTLDAADPSLPRIDVITLDTLQQIEVIKGTPAADPAKPQIDPNKQIELTQVLINAGATEPADVTRRTVYDENIEFTTASTWSTTVNFNNTTGSFNGTKSIAAGAFVAGNELKFTNALPLNVSNYNNFVFFVNLLATFSNANGFQVSFWNGVSRVSSYVSVTNNNYGFSRTLTGSYQAINIPISAFSFTGSTFDIIKINMIGSSSSTFRMDFIQLQSGINQTISAPVASLQQVTNAGNITTNPIFAQQFGLAGGKAILFEEDNGGALEITDTSGNAAFSVYGSDTGVIRLANALNLLDVKWNKVSGSKTQYFANANGVIPMIVKVNGTDYVANDSGRINLGTIAGGGSQSFDDVLSVGNFTSRTPRTSAGYEVRNTGNTATLAEIFNNGNTNAELYLYNTTDSRYAMLKYTGLEFQLPSFKLQRINPFPTPTASSVVFTLPNTVINRYIPTTFKLNGTTVAASDTGLVDLGTVAVIDSSVYATQYRLDTTRNGIRADLNGKQGALTLTTTGSSGAATLVGNTLNIPQYSGGGGGTADSSWVSSETGVAPSQLGYLVNSTLSALPSGWADVTPAASVTFSGKMIVSGGATTTASVTGNTGTGTAYANRIDMDYYPYSKMRYAFTVVPQDKTGTSNGFALHFKANALTTSFAMRIVFDLTNTADSGKISMGYDYSAAVSTSANLSHNAGDTLDIQIVRDHWLIYAKMYNRRTGKQVDTKYYSYGSDFGTGGMAYLALLGGEQHFLSAKVQSYDLKDGAAFTFLGDSQFAGSGATNEDKTFPFQIFRGNKNKIANLSAPGVTLSAIVNSHVPAAIALNNPVIVGAGFNDRSVLSTDTTTFKTRLDAVVDPLIAAGLPVWVTTLVPTAQTSATLNNNFDLAIINYCAANGIPVIRIDSILKKNGDAQYRIKENYSSQDVVHWSDSGQYVAAQKVLQIIGERMPTYFKDTTSPVKFYNVPTGEQNMSMLVLDEKTSEVKKVPAITYDIIYNSYKYGGSGTIAQRNTAIHVDKTITTDSALLVHSSSGLKIGFNGGTSYSAGNTGSNIVITSVGASGFGYPQSFPSQTGLRQIVFQPFSLKTSGGGSFSGNDIFIAQFANSAAAVTGSRIVSFSGRIGDVGTQSGSDNSWMSYESGRGVTTGSNNFHAVMRNATGAIFPSSLSGSVVIGDFPTIYTPENNAVYLSGGNGNVDQKYYFGGGAQDNTYFQVSPTYVESNRNGSNWYFRSSAGRGTGGGGNFIFQTWTAAASGTTLQTTPQTELTIERNIVKLNNRFQTSTGADVASANDLTLGNDGNVFTITGTTQINAITTTNWQAGSEIILIFSGSVTVKNNTAGGANTAVMLLAGGVDFSATSNDVLKLVYNGTSWFEVSRSVN